MSQTNTKPVEGTETANRPASPSELMASAKVVAEAAQDAARNESDKLDKAKVAGDSADILDVDQEYGRFDKSDAGQYFEKAEKYLKDFESSGAVVTPYTPDIGAPPPSASRWRGVWWWVGMLCYKMAQVFMKCGYWSL